MSRQTLTAVNPATDEVIGEHAMLDAQGIRDKLDATRRGYDELRRLTVAERAKKLHAVADLIEERQADIGEVICREMGKKFGGVIAETRISAAIVRFYADHAEEFMAPKPKQIPGAQKAEVVRDPMGAVLGIMPWNYPLYQVVRFAAPNLAGGNACLLKHASNVPGSAKLITQLFHDAGFDEGTFTWLPVSSSEIEGILRDPIVCGVTLTGSEEAGRAVAKQAGELVKPSVLELGGIDPLIVLDDADVDKAVEIAIEGRFDNTGQSCAASKRLIVVESMVERFTERLVDQVQKLRIGNPLDEDTDIGPMSRKDLRDDLHDQVKRAVQNGAQIETGGQILDRPGAWYAPTVLTNVAPGNPAFDEELFGPVASVITADNAEHAIELANRSPYGLGGTVVGQDVKRAEQVARRLDVGMSFVNRPTTPFAELPFGGVKLSGYGREQSEYGFGEFLNVRTVFVAE
ncbi:MULTISPECIES: NAD-dependent succinate-semialdehyde dehydrogenase [Modicisalibacter]|uniref:NAD-dependent succinate-semialdehyde dehydrogenase n=1 Tax=Modicisalibacter TaxID=574347 RepID=UPI001396BEAA|nr:MULTISPECIES: NAD-dependent succinate-semialdehyde dehydrogenase [Halomonadaceae]MBZ9559237.1 NAD-dependent succinate-semialdehyde dehydrogenase [Modicisalibacter sp. R2A 31.J]MBZ9576598.1 NAD-dependent succinate-semialdehyde dehydrogenase [Modicisalibacter sp. MOD 31.J]